MKAPASTETLVPAWCTSHSALTQKTTTNIHHLNLFMLLFSYFFLGVGHDLAGLGTKNERAGEDQQQFTPPTFSFHPISCFTTNIYIWFNHFLYNLLGIIS
jgi:hypothetical protein